MTKCADPGCDCHQYPDRRTAATRAVMSFDDFMANMPILEKRFRKYEEALKAIAKEGDKDHSPVLALSATGHLNCRLIAKDALKP